MAVEAGEIRKWEAMIPDALGLIFKHLPLCDVLTVVPGVCKSWRSAVMGPYCWLEIDIKDWSRNADPEIVDRMLHLLLPRSGGSLRKLCVTGLTNHQSISFIANHARSLKTLRLQRCTIPDSVMANVARMFANITILDLSYCLNTGPRALEAIGNNCKSLTTLCRIMHPLEVVKKPPQDEEAIAIANTMPGLRHLEIAYLLVTTSSVTEIIWKCKNLEVLDIRGCWDVTLDEGFLKGLPKLKVIGPLVIDYNATWDNLSDYSGLSGYLAWDFVAGELDEDEEEDYPELLDELWGNDEDPVEEVEMWFYDDFGFVDDAGSDWPRSP